MVRVLVAAGANVHQGSVDGSSPLLVATQNGNYEIARFLLDHGATPNDANLKGWTWLEEDGARPLLRAALCDDLTVVRLLLAHGADPLLGTFDHTTPLMVASGVGWAEGFTFEYSEDETLELVKLLLDKGAVVNDANDHGITPLHGAAYKGTNKVVQLLVDRGADMAAQDKGEDFGFGVSSVRMTPLNWAEGVPIGMSSAIPRPGTVTLLVRLMQEKGIPVVYNTFHGQKAGDAPIIPEPK